jgi:hypothetical protein
MRVGMQLFASLAATYPLYRGGPVAGTCAEIFPNASACVLAGELRSRGTTKSDARRGVLREWGVAEQELPTLDRVDAALAALTGVIALQDGHSAVGDPAEGLILLPVPVLPDGRLPVGPAQQRQIGSIQVTKRTRSGSGQSVQIGYVNRNGQVVVGATGKPGTDHGQSLYVIRCGHCAAEYHSNGSDNFQRKCPACQGGAPSTSFG